MQHEIEYVIKYFATALQSVFTNLTPDFCEACFSNIILCTSKFIMWSLPFGLPCQKIWWIPHIFLKSQQPLVYQGLFVIEASRSQLDTSQSVELYWTSDQPDAETSVWHHTTLTAPLPQAGFETPVPASEWPQTHSLNRAATGIGVFLTNAMLIAWLIHHGLFYLMGD